ncbi:MAG: hypothetical protein IJ943_10935 [Akkermansia sp.]|nr:hypothetical protein [Akkermansia sp.]
MLSIDTTPPVHAAGMNIVAAQRQYRWPKANIVFAAGKNIVLQYTSHPNNKAGIGKPPPNARKSSSELISAPRSCRRHEYRCRAAAISLAKGQYRFCRRQKYRSPIHLTPKQQSRHWEPSSQCPQKLISTYIQPPPFMPQA